MIVRYIAALTMTCLAVSACAQQSAPNVPKESESAAQCSYPVKDRGNRRLGMDILNTLEKSDYTKNQAKLAALGGTYQHFSMSWSMVEPKAGNGAEPSGFVDPNNYLAMMSAASRSANMKITLILKPIDTTGKTVPPDLAALNFNDPIVITRFTKFLDFILSKIPPDQLVDVMVGNEVNTYNPGDDENFWVEYANFLAGVRAHARTKYPTLRIGFVATFAGLTDSSMKTPDGWPSQKVLQTFATMVDVVGVTYYPLHADFSVKSPQTAEADIKRLLQSIPSGNFHFTEVGYPSSQVNGSSENMQAAFFCEFLRAWDQNAARIPYVSLLRLNDIPRSEAKDIGRRYGLTSDAFIEYLRTLGIIDESANEKAAYSLLGTQLNKRGF